MPESWISERLHRGQRWLQAQVQETLERATIPLASSAAHQPPLYWGTDVAPRATLYLWLAEEPHPRQLPFARSLILDCGAGVRLRQHYARSYIARSLRQLRLLAPSWRPSPLCQGRREPHDSAAESRCVKPANADGDV